MAEVAEEVHLVGGHQRNSTIDVMIFLLELHIQLFGGSVLV